MKKLLFALLLLTGSATIGNSLQAQVTVNVNIGSQPAWASVGYDNTPYYYMPDLDIYYDVPAHVFVYLSNGRWVRTAVLPAVYQQYDLYQVYKVPLKESNAYLKHATHIKQYAAFKGKPGQTPIRDSKDDKYASNKNNWKDGKFQQGHYDSPGKANKISKANTKPVKSNPGKANNNKQKNKGH